MRQKDEQKLIDTVRRWLGADDEAVSDALYHEAMELGEKVAAPTTREGQAIKTWMDAEVRTDFSLGAQAEYSAMQEALGNIC